MIDCIQVQKQVVGRKIRRTIRRLQDRIETVQASLYYVKGDPSGYWEAMDDLRASLARQRSAMKRIKRL